MLARNVQREIERDLNLQSQAAMANSDAGTSSGSAGGDEYQVFLNFCGQDTRDGFTGFLYEGLRNNGIYVFMDDKELRVGEEIRELLRAIDNSQIYVPIFSENYASRKWCLRELVRMVDNISKSVEKKILPIFYYVEPDDVAGKSETTSYRTAIQNHKAEHEKKQQEKLPHERESWEGESWEETLKNVNEFKGWVLRKGQRQAELVDSVVKVILQELKIRYKSVTKDLVGLDDRVAEVLKLLDVNRGDKVRLDKVRLLGIHGMGGIGKTTIAKVVYNELSSCFGKCCAFLDDVRETLNKDGLVWLQKKLLTDIDSSSAAESIREVDHGRKMIESVLGNKKVLIVLDDVDEEKQVENLIGHRWYPGTRIIITTRNTSVLEFIKQRMAPEMNEVNSDPAVRILPFEMAAMNFDDALQLFKRHAFCEDSLAADFDDLSRDVVSTTGCLPLALEVIGSSLRGGDKAKWENTLNKLKNIPDEHVQEKLMISYNDLNYHQHEIFLDVACFFINEDITNAKYMWEASEFYPNLEIDVLVRKSLIKIKDGNKFWMHDQLRDLGREIVRRQSPTNLEKRSRLWTSEEVLDLVKTEERCGDVEALDLQGQERGFYISISPRRFKSLRFLRLSKVDMHGHFIVSLPKLRWISWRSCCQRDNGPSIHSKNLVVLELFDIYFKDDSKVWDVIKMATKLKNLTLVSCLDIIETPDLSKCLDLERLTFKNCWSLKKFDKSIGKLKCLLDLNITGCHRIERVPDQIGRVVKLEHFSLCGCKREIQLHSFSQLRYLRLEKCDLQSLSIPSSLRTLKVRKCPNIVEIQVLGMSASLEILDVSDCQSIGRMVLCGEGASLEVLDQSESSSSGANYCSPRVLLPNAFKKLKTLEVEFCQNLVEIQVIGTQLSLQDISIYDCDAMEKLTGVSNLKKLSSLFFFECPMLRVVEGLDKLEFLTSLTFNGCPSVEKLPGISNSQISDECEIFISRCRKSIDSLDWLTSSKHILFKRYKELMEEAEMEGDAKKPGIGENGIGENIQWLLRARSSAELQPQFHPSTSSRDHEISEEPPIDNVREGTPPGKQNQTTKKDSHRLKKYILNLTTTCFCKS